MVFKFSANTVTTILIAGAVLLFVLDKREYALICLIVGVAIYLINKVASKRW